MCEAIFKKANQSDIGPNALDRIATFPFTEDRKRETAIIRQDSRQLMVASKGAAEVILAMCLLDEGDRNAWLSKIEELVGGAHKVIAVASRVVDASADLSSEPSSEFQFAGLLAFEDPVRVGVQEAVAECQSAGIHVIMVTGDHTLTAQAVAIEVGTQTLLAGHATI